MSQFYLKYRSHHQQDFGIPEMLNQLGIKSENMGLCTGTQWFETQGTILTSSSPIDGHPIAKIHQASSSDYIHMVDKALQAFHDWRRTPAPKRGDIVRKIGNALREEKENLAKLISLEMGKIYQESLGEVQEMIDICDFAVGLSRQLYGYTMQSERPGHRLLDQYHPLGVVGIISAFNFPMAVWAWNTMIALVCGDVCVWKPSSKVPLCAIAVHHAIEKVLKDNKVTEGVVNLIVAPSSEIGDLMAEDKRISLISITGSTQVGKKVSQKVGARLGRTIAELGGNNAIIVTQTADLQLAIPAIVFGAVGTTGQRCTSTRRLIIHDSIYSEVIDMLKKAYQQIKLKIGHPLDPKTIVGPLIDDEATELYKDTIRTAQEQGCSILFGNKVITSGIPDKGHYVLPTIIEAQNHLPIVQHESFVPVLYLMKYQQFEEAISMHNDVPQGLSSSIFSRDMQECETFISGIGSDCGIANVNIGTSGAEIGGAFGGEKETGGGRESGSDAWKAYMRQQTNTINWSKDLPLAQGIQFEL
ncbi:L-piperidine-6-carboxylate dehydrogenase [Saccharicrinis fermentans]|uniref:aldehyde dehydrogenase (NAD(+)) n=1 Tax=Saccharicrinis fermentans DSM 9555 = JCM 21142 TaxID=869213 RepID=W7XY35_9BACT|nr:aldehyde dehydrogenase family protein [Saccharicrinis fermentans]GAF03515.1 succinate-semialdehyde dehydrogenase [Saccharicrinis fermentans DSM 9555 = JCM 21142]